MFIGAQFCSDSFSSISLDAFNAGSSYAFYARQDQCTIGFVNSIKY